MWRSVSPWPEAPPPPHPPKQEISSLYFDGESSFATIPFQSRAVSGSNNSLTFEVGRCRLNR
jgi:hypothetical protein